MSHLRLFEFQPAQLAQFWPQVPRLYWQAQSKVHEEYQYLLYHVQHAFQPRHLAEIESAFGLPPPGWSAGSREEVIRILDNLRYPNTRGLGELRAVPGLDLQTMSHYLHFFHHAYPIYTRESLAGLAKLGVDLPFTKVRDPDVYGLYIEALDELKERAPFRSVPETNVFLARILQGALHAYGS